MRLKVALLLFRFVLPEATSSPSVPPGTRSARMCMCMCMACVLCALPRACTWHARTAAYSTGMHACAEACRKIDPRGPWSRCMHALRRATPAGPEKQYLRLPVESARRLRWYDKADMQALVKTHLQAGWQLPVSCSSLSFPVASVPFPVLCRYEPRYEPCVPPSPLQEKRELNEAVSVLKRMLVRSGAASEAEMDLELSHVLERADEVREADEGVHEVLLLSLQAGVEQLQEANARLQEEVEALRGGGGGGSFSGGGAAAAAAGGLLRIPSSSSAALDPALMADLQQSVSELEAYMSAAASLSRQVCTLALLLPGGTPGGYIFTPILLLLPGVTPGR